MVWIETHQNSVLKHVLKYVSPKLNRFYSNICIVKASTFLREKTWQNSFFQALAFNFLHWTLISARCQAVISLTISDFCKRLVGQTSSCQKCFQSKLPPNVSSSKPSRSSKQMLHHFCPINIASLASNHVLCLWLLNSIFTRILDRLRLFFTLSMCLFH